MLPPRRPRWPRRPPRSPRAPSPIAAPSEHRVPFVGLTGGIGAGKSTALAALERLGAAVLSSDAVVHELYESDAVRDEVVARFGAEVAPGGRVDRAAVASRAFAAEDDRAWLEGMLWPRVGARIWEWRREVERREPPPVAAIVEVPLLFEADMDGAFDATVAVLAEEETRARRADSRGHAAGAERLARQLSQEEKARRATHAVRNDGSEADLERALSAVLAKL